MQQKERKFIAKLKRHRRGLALGTAAAALVLGGALALTTLAPGPAVDSGVLDPGESLTASVSHGNAVRQVSYQTESADKFADVMHIDGPNGEQSLSDTEKGSYSGFIFKVKAPQDGAGDVRAKMKAAVKRGLVEHLHGQLYSTDSLDALANLLDASQLEYVEPDFNLQLVGDVDDTSSEATADSARAQQNAKNAVSPQGGTAPNPAPDWPPNDQQYAAQRQWNLDMLNVKGAWEQGLDGDSYTYNGKQIHNGPVKVAVIDTGLYGTGQNEGAEVKHEDLDYSHVADGKNFATDDTGTPDAQGHGTFVSGLIAAKTGNATGIAGAMPGATIVPEKVFDTSDASTKDVVSAIYQAVDADKVDVINMSLGGAYNEHSLEEACDYAVSKGVLVVASAGNDGNSTPNYPAAYDSVVGVASVGSTQARSSFSQYGKSVFVTAPGEKVTSTFNGGNSSYKTGSGTSFSGPMVAAEAAMCKAVYPDMDQDIFKQMLIDSSTDLGEKGYDDFYGYGLVNYGKMAEQVLASQVLPWYNVSFSLVDENGAAVDVKDATITLTAADAISWDADAENGIPDAGTIAKGEVVQPNADGTYKLHRGTYDYKIVHDGTYTVTGTFKTYAENQTVSAKLPKAYATTVKVIDSAGTAVKDAKLELTSAAGRAEDPKSSGGATQVFDLASGRYGYRVLADGYETSVGSFMVQRADSTIEATLYKAGELATVSFAASSEGKTVGDAGFSVSDSSGVVLSPAGDGSYRLARGKTYKVTASRIGYEDKTLEFTVDQGASQTVAVELAKATAAITFKAVDADGNELGGFSVQVADEKGTAATAAEGMPNRFYLKQGSYTYRVNKAGYTSAQGRIEVSSESRTYTATLAGIPYKVDFAVTDSAGTAIEDAAVKVSTDKTLRAIAQDEDGGYSLTPGTYRYTVYKDGYAAARGTFQVVDRALSIPVKLAAKAGGSEEYAGGTGTKEDPYLIATEAQLRHLAQQTEIVRMTNTSAPTNKKARVSGYYQLVNDIELKDGDWLPIGNQENSSNYVSFSGNFDGNGHTVSGLRVSGTDESGTKLDAQGLFGYVSGATITNLTVEGSVAGDEYVGGLVGRAYTDTYDEGAPTVITGCGNRTDVSGRFAVGGIVGSASTTAGSEKSSDGVIISECYNAGNIAAAKDGVFGRNSYRAGGIAGSLDRATVTSCYNAGAVESGYQAGGIVGGVNNQVKVSCSYNSGPVVQHAKGTGFGGTSGGIVGYSYGSAFSDCYALEREENTGSNYYGSTDSNSTFKNCAMLPYEDMYRSDAFLDKVNSDSATGTKGTAFVLGNDFPLLSWQVPADALLAAMPHITTQPQAPAAAYKAGTAAGALTVKAAEVNDGGTVTWQWYVSDSPNGADAQAFGDPGEGTDASVVPSTDQTGTRYYFVVFTNTLADASGHQNVASSKSSIVPVTVRSTTDAREPVITALNPTSTQQVNTNVSAKAGTDLELSVSAQVRDGGELSYQWFRSDSPAGEGKLVEDGDDDDTRLSLDTGKIAKGYYYVVVTNTLEKGNSASKTSDWITAEVLPYTISSYEELASFRSSVNSGTTFAGIDITLKADVAIPAGTDWEPIGTKEHPFEGTFIGGKGYAGSEASVIQTHKITGISVNGAAHSNEYLGLFGFTMGATILDVQVQGTVTGVENRYAGLLVGYAGPGGEIANCATLAGSSVEGKYYLGGLAGYSACSVSNCANHADVTAKAYTPNSADNKITAFGSKSAGGLVGYSAGSVVGSYNTGAVTAEAVSGGVSVAEYVGGVVGYGAYGTATISCFDSGKVTVGSYVIKYAEKGTHYAGAVVGHQSQDNVENLHYVEGCYERGTDGSSKIDYAEYHSPQFAKTAYFVNLLNTGSKYYSYKQFTASKNGVPHLVWEEDVTQAGGEVYAAEPYIYDVSCADESELTSTWKLSYYAGEKNRPIYVYADSPDGGMLGYQWQVSTDGGTTWDNASGEGASGMIPAAGEEQSRAGFAPDVSQAGSFVYRCTVTNTRSDATAGHTTKELAAPDISIEVKQGSGLIQLRDPNKPNGKDNPWIIKTAEQLRTFQQVVDGKASLAALSKHNFAGQYVSLESDIDLSEFGEWDPIGFGSQSTGDFEGFFEGNGHVVSGMKITKNASDNGGPVGFFANVRGGKISDLEVRGSISVDGASGLAAGGVVGYSYGGWIENVMSDVDVCGAVRLGGIVGYAGSCRIVDCENLGDISQNEAIKAKKYGGYDVGGIVGYAFNVHEDVKMGIFNCLNAGQVSGTDYDGDLRVGAIIGNDSDGAMPVTHSYYRAGSVICTTKLDTKLTGRGTSAKEPVSDAAGECLAVSDTSDPATAWALNTADGTQQNSGRWGVFAKASGETAAVHLVRDPATADQAIYRIDKSDPAADVTVSASYAKPGDTVTVSWKSKSGFTVKTLAYKQAGGEELHELGTGASSSADASFTMPAADVSFASTYDQDVQHKYGVTSKVSYKTVGTAAPAGAASVSFSPATAVAGNTVKATVTLGSAYQVKSASAQGASGANVPLTREDALHCSFVMPAEDVVLSLVIEDKGAAATTEAESLAPTKAATHYGSSDDAYRTGQLRWGTISFSGSYFGKESYATTWGIENDAVEAKRGGLYEQDYSVRGKNGTTCYTGVRITDLIKSETSGTAPAAGTAVQIEGSDGRIYRSTYGELAALDRNAYDSNGQPLVHGLPALLAFGADGTPFADAPAHFVIGQKSADDDNAAAEVVGVQRICVGDDINYSQHVYAPYNDMAAISGEKINGEYGQSDLHIRVKDTAGKVVREKVYSLNDIERMARGDRGHIAHGYYTVQMYTEADTPYSDRTGQSTFSDYYEGYDLSALFKDMGIPANKDGSVQFYQSGKNGLENSWKTVRTSLDYILGSGSGGTGDYSGNYLTSGYASGNSAKIYGARPLVGYGKNGLPLVWSSGSVGCVQGSYNYRGPLMAILPANATEGGQFVGSNTAVSCFLGLIEVTLPEGAMQAGGGSGGTGGSGGAGGGGAVVEKSLGSVIDEAQAALDAATVSADGSDVELADTWVTQADANALSAAIARARSVLADDFASKSALDAAQKELQAAINAFSSAKKEGAKGLLSKAEARAQMEKQIVDVKKQIEGLTQSADGTDVPTSEKWAPAKQVEEARAAAEKCERLLADDTATQRQLNSALNELKAAVESLAQSTKAGTKKAEKPGAGESGKPDTGEPGKSGQGTQGDQPGKEQGKGGAVKGHTAKKAVTSVTVNARKVTAKKLAQAVKKAGATSRSLKQVTLGKKVKRVSKRIFKKYKKLKTLVVKTKKLTGKSLKGALAGSKVKTAKIKVGSSKRTNKKYAKKYQKIFVKKTCGKKVAVK